MKKTLNTKYLYKRKKKINVTQTLPVVKTEKFPRGIWCNLLNLQTSGNGKRDDTYGDFKRWDEKLGKGDEIGLELIDFCFTFGPCMI